MEVTPFYEKKIECLHCKKTFSTLKVRSKSFRVVKSDTDFQPIYDENQINALYYNVFVCEHCGFSFTEDFSKYFAPGVSEEINRQITSKWNPHNFRGERTVFQAIEAYKLAFLCATLKKEKSIIMAGLLLRLAWLYRSLKNTGQEERFMKMARDHYVESYSTGDYLSTQMTDVRVMYIIGELSRRIGDDSTATRFFSRVIESKRFGGEAKLIEMARNQWNLMRAGREHLDVKMESEA